MKEKRMIWVWVCLFAISSLFVSCGHKKDQAMPRLGIDPVEEVIAMMTPEEKVGITVGDGKFLPAVDQENIEYGTGVIIANQNSKMLIPRLGIYSLALADGPSGMNLNPLAEGSVEPIYTTAFPTSTCVAASWNIPLAEEIGKVFGNEILEYDYDVILMPALNIHRNPKCGRNFEYYSEDPLLSGKMSAALVNGLQSKGIGSTLKHFLANNQEVNRRDYNAVISQRALREIYLRGFEIAVKESSPLCIMTSYNRLNGFYTAENPELLRDIVRDEWKYEGTFMTDFDGYGSAVAKVRAGNNMLMSGSPEEVAELTAALKDKSLDEETLAKSLEYALKLKLKMPRAKNYRPSFKPDLEKHAQVAREMASEGMVLLKNSGNTLPLSGVKNVAVYGKISYYLIEAGTGSGGMRSNKYAVSVNEGLKAAGFEVIPELENSYMAYIHKIIEENRVPPYFDNPKMRAQNGITDDQSPPHFKKRLVPFSAEMPIAIGEVRKHVNDADIAVVTLGRSAGESYENGYMPFSDVEIEMLKNVCEVYHSAGKKVVVVLNVGGVCETASWRDYPDAILMAWQPGQEGGHAVADILKGTVNPSGKLPDSFPLKYEDVPSAASYPGEPADEPINTFYSEGIYVGYRYYGSFDVPTAYDFGFGLSYTDFEYNDLKLSSDVFNDNMTVTVSVKNSGKVAGKEVVQLYLSAPMVEIEKPDQELKGFAKTKLLQTGESQQLSFELDPRSLASFHSGISSWLADAGDYEVRVAASSKDIRLKASFSLEKPILVEKVNDVLYPNFYMKELSRYEKQ
ncbi:MAG: beta-glucosidase [Fermentimonas sp.]